MPKRKLRVFTPAPFVSFRSGYSWRNHLVRTGAHLGFSEGRGPNFRKGANQYKAKKNILVITFKEVKPN